MECWIWVFSCFQNYLILLGNLEEDMDNSHKTYFWFFLEIFLQRNSCVDIESINF